MYIAREIDTPSETVSSFLEERRAPFTQGYIYSTWQKGREVRRFVVEKDGEIQAYFQMIKFPLLLGKSYFYVPYGPVLKDSSLELLKYLRQFLLDLRLDDAVYVRLDFYPKVETSVFYRVPKILSKGSHFQPRQEWYLSLEKSPEVIFDEMDKKTRYSIRTAEKRGVETIIIKENFTKYFPDFLRLMKVTAERNGFALHYDDYYKNIFLELDKKNEGGSFLVLGLFEGKVLVVDLVIVANGIANYVFGASSNEERNRLPSYLVQWEAIKKSKELGCTEYNFGGVSLGKGETWAGLTDYKVKFGGRVIVHSDYYDLILKPFWYFVYLLRKLLK